MSRIYCYLAALHVLNIFKVPKGQSHDITASIYGQYLALWTEPVALRLCGQFEALGVVDARAELTAEHLTLAVTHPAVEVIPPVLRYNINRVCGECGLLHIVKGTMS